MDTSILLDRAQLLLEQGRHSDASTNVRQALEIDPRNDYALSLLGRCHYANKQFDAGIEVMKQAIALDPTESFYFYLLAFGHYQLNRAGAAVENLEKALQLNPYHAEFYGLLAYVHLYQKNFTAALEKANEGLAINSDNITCLNARSVALNKLKKTDAAIATMQTALAQDPDNEMTHATVGWNMLEKGKHKDATRHFLEALRIDPNYDNARAGLKEALKSGLPPYRWLLQYSFWIQNKGRRLSSIAPIALYIIFRIGIAISSGTDNNALAWILAATYILIVVTSWTINSIANFFLLSHPIGKHALTVTEKWASLTVVGALGAGLLLMAVAQFTPAFDGTAYESTVFIAGVVCLSLALPLSGIAYPLHFRRKSWQEWYGLLLVAAGLAGLALFIFQPAVAMSLFIVYGIAFIIYNWVALVRR